MIKKTKRTFYEVPRFPDVPHEEWKTRNEKVKKLMAENGIDCLVLWARENIRYFFGFMTIHWYLKTLQPAVAIIPVAEEPILIVPKLLKGTAEGFCWVKDIHIYEDVQRTETQRALPVAVADIIKRIGCGNKNIALEMGTVGCMWIPRPLNDIEAFKKALPEATFVDGDQVIWNCRMIKSPLEIDRITRSVNMVAEVELAIVEGYRPGMSEVELMKVNNRARAEQLGNCTGDDGVTTDDFICSSEKMFFADIKALEGAMITEDDAIQFAAAVPYKGYTPDNSRRWEVGKVTKEKRRRHELLWKGQDNAQSMLKPGVKTKEVYEALYKPIAPLSSPEKFRYATHGGHGTGLDLQEPPSINPWDETVIQEGMVINIEAWLNQAKGSNFGLGDTFVITDKGCMKIDGLRRDIIQVFHPWM